MGAAAEIGLTFSRELRRNLRSVKGIVSSLLFLLGGAGALLIYVNVSREMDRLGPGFDSSARDQMRRAGLRALYDDPSTADHLIGAPTALFFLYKATLFFLPILCILVGYDQLSGDLQYRTIRYATVRSRRESLVVGKALGTWVAASLIALGLQVFAWILTIARGDATVGVTVAYGMQFWLATVIYSSGFVGLTMLLSGAFKTPMLALLTTLAAAFGWWLLRAIVQIPSLKPTMGWLGAIVPGEWEPRLLSPDVTRFAVGALALLVIGAVGTLGACGLLRSRDV